MGVDLFFVISGFVIGMSAFDAIKKHGVKNFRKPFFSRRLARIVPLHYLTMLVFVVFISPELLFNNFWLNVASHLAFLHNFDISLHGAINGSNWSLATEMQFYVLMLLAAPWIRTAKLWKIAFVFIGVSWAWRYGVTLFVQPSAQLGPFPVFVAATQLPGMLDEFVAGLILARFVRSEAGNKLLSENNIYRFAIFSITAVLMTVCLWVYWTYASFWNYPAMVTFFRTLLALSFALVILCACTFTITGKVRKLLEPLYYLGTISYGLYLWHLPVLISLKRISWINPGQALFLTVSITILFASVSWHFFEQPFVRKTHRKPELHPLPIQTT